MSDNKTNKNIKAFAFAMVLVGEVVGVSFSTGREALTYFANFGRMSLVGMFLAYVLIFLYGYMSYVTARNMDKYTFDWVITPKGWKPLRYFNLIFALIFLINALSAMFAATGAILQAIFGIPYIVGSLVMLIASVLTVTLSINGFANTLKIMVPIMAVLAIAIGILCAVSPAVEGSSWESAYSDNALLRTWWLSAFVYFGLQTGPLVQTVIPIAPQVEGKRTAAISHVIGGLIIFIIAAILCVATVRNYSIAVQAEIPIVEIAFAKSTPIGLIYCIAALLAIFSTTSAFLFIIKASLLTVQPLKESKLKLNATLLIMSLVGLAASTMGFSNIVDKVYAVIGYASFIGIAGLTYNYFYYRKNPVNKETAVD